MHAEPTGKDLLFTSLSLPNWIDYTPMFYIELVMYLIVIVKRTLGVVLMGTDNT